MQSYRRTFIDSNQAIVAIRDDREVRVCRNEVTVNDSLDGTDTGRMLDWWSNEISRRECKALN